MLLSTLVCLVYYHTFHYFSDNTYNAMGYRVTALKIDPYLNVDAGTMSPFEHGEGKLLNHMHMF